MKRMLTMLLSLVLVGMVAGQLPVPTSAGRDCGGATHDGSCREHSHRAADQPPANASCATCCLMCCVMIAPPAIEVTAPVATSISWARLDLDPLARTEKPPLPPPRLS